MSIRSFIVCSVSALLVLAVACDAPREVTNQSGTLAVTIAAATDDVPSSISEGSIAITGLDRPLHTNVALASGIARGSLEVSLPPGLYGVQWKPNPLSAGEGEPLLAESAVSVVVVAAGGSSSVVLRAAPAPESSAAQRFATAESKDVVLASR